MSYPFANCLGTFTEIRLSHTCCHFDLKFKNLDLYRHRQSEIEKIRDEEHIMLEDLEALVKEF